MRQNGHPGADRRPCDTGREPPDQGGYIDSEVTMSSHGKPNEDRTPKNRSESEREEERHGETVEDKGASGAPQGGQIDGRQGDQQGMKR